jgi:hypothetical protein
MTIGQDETPDATPATSGAAPQGAPARPHAARWVVLALGAAALLVGVWIVSVGLPGWLTQPDAGTSSADDVTGGTVESRRIQATLFYVAEDGTALVPTSRTVLYSATPVEQARRLVEAQVAAPPEGLVSAIPAGTTVRGVFLTDAQEAYVDLGGAIVSGHSGGLLDEALTVYSIVNALTVNLPEVTAVQILIEGREVDSLRGHIDLRAPLGRATDWIQKGSSAQ